MDLPIAFPENGRFANLKKFKKSPTLYMKEAIARHGAPVDLNLPMGEFVVTDDPEHAHRILNTNKENYTKSKGYREIAHVLGEGLLTAEGERWKSHRKALQPSFHTAELRKLLPAVWETGEDFVASVDTKQPLQLDKQMGYLTLTILLNSLIHYRNEELKKEMIGNVLFGQEFIVNRIRTPFKPPLWFPTRQNIRYHAMMRQVDGLMKQCVAERQKAENAGIQDILSVLIRQFDPENEFKKIRDELMTFFVAGHETSSLGLAWTLHLLAHYPEAQQRLFEEVRSIKTLDDVDWLNFGNVKWLQKIIKESLRLYPPIWNIVRRAKTEDRLGDYRLPKGKQVMMNIYLLHRNKEYWRDPETFDPERFENGDFRHKLQFMPFGAGPRFCIGNNFALFEMMIVLIQFIRAFKALPKTPLNTGFNPLLTLRPQGALEVMLEKR